jgi:hypothetical protein
MREIAKLQQKVDLLRNADHEFRLFGAAAHRYEFNPCLDEDTLQAFEADHHIALPSDYRQFLLHMGNGGAGPHYGIAMLQQAVILSASDFLMQPFPYTHFWNGMDPPDWFARDLSPDEIEQVGWTLDETAYFADYHRHGTLQLVHEGCGYYSLLVISGPERGHMWHDARASDGGIQPLPDYKSDKRITFWQWYEYWLDVSLQQCCVTLPTTEE